MSLIPSLSRSRASARDDTDKLIEKTLKYLNRLQDSMTGWKNQEEANNVRVKLAMVLKISDTGETKRGLRGDEEGIKRRRRGDEEGIKRRRRGD